MSLTKLIKLAATTIDGVRNGAAGRTGTTGSSSGIAGKMIAEGAALLKSTNSNSTPTDAVTLSKEAKSQSNPYSSIAKSAAKVKVDKWGTGKNDCLESILMNKGYTAEEIYSKGADGKSLLDRVVSTNKLRNADLIQAGQNLIVPSKEEPKNANSANNVPPTRAEAPASNGWNFEKNGGGFLAAPNYSGSESLAQMKADFQKSDSAALHGLDAALRSLMNPSESPRAEQFVGPLAPSVSPAESFVGPVAPPMSPVETFVGPVAPSMSPAETFVGPVAPSVSPAETFIGPVDHTVGPAETFIGPVNSYIAPDAPYFA